MQASRTLPIVFVANNYDPIARGYVAQPGGSRRQSQLASFCRRTELAEKQVELLTQAFPDRTRLAVFWDAISADQFAAASQTRDLTRPGNTRHTRWSTGRTISPRYIAMYRTSGANSVLVAVRVNSLRQQRDQIVEHAINQRLPTMFIFKAYVRCWRAVVIRR